MNIISYPDDANIGKSLATRSMTPAVLGNAEVEDSAPLDHYWRVLARRKWIILGSILVALLIGAILTVLTTPQYVATATVEISRESEAPAAVEGVTEQPTTIDQEFYETQYGLLRSRALARSVAQQLNLPEDAQFREIFELDDNGLLKGGDGGKIDAVERSRRLDEAEQILLDHVTVAPANSSRLVDLRFSSPDPFFSAKVANGWIDNFMKSSLERRFESASFARNFLEGRLEQVRKRLEDAERQLVAYATAQGIVSVNSDPTGSDPNRSEQSLASNNLSLMNTELAAATADRIRAESRLREARGRGTAPESLANAAISTLRQKRAEAAAEYDRMMVDFEPGYPKARALESQIQALDRSIAQEEGRVSTSLRDQYAAAVQRENAVRARVNQSTGDVMDLRRRSIQYNILKRDVDTSRTLYEGLLQRYKEIGIAGGVGKNNIAVVDEAKPPASPSSPRPLLNMILAFIAGSILGVILAFAAEQIDEAITDPDELPRRLGLALLGVIARAKDDDPLTAFADRSSGVTEGYLSVRTNLQFSTPTGVPKTIVITSSRSSEGKTTSAVAIAVVLARAGKRVLLVDADMRSPSIHHVLRVKNEHGLSSLLSGNGRLEDLMQPTAVDSLFTLSSGPRPPNAAELLSSQRLDLIFDAAGGQFDHVIVDSPPVLGLADAPLLANRAEAVIFIVQARGTKARVIERSIARLRKTQSRILGGILTKFDPKFAHAGYGEEYQYKYGQITSEVA